MDYWTAAQYAGSALGMIGSATNSYGARFARITWPGWFASNLLLLAYTGYKGEWGMFAMNLFNLCTTVNGLTRQLILPWLARHTARAVGTDVAPPSEQPFPSLDTHDAA